MGLKVYWTAFSKKELRKIYSYYKKTANKKIAKTLVNNIVLKTETLSNFPKLGSKELLLENRHENFRKLIFKNYKIIYWINFSKQRVEIADIFDVRQNPKKMDKNIKL